MEKRYYLDTSIWLDLFEDRDVPGLPKGEYAKKLMDKVVRENSVVVYSDTVIDELLQLGYRMEELESRLKNVRMILYYAESNKKQFNMAKDASKKRAVPLFDALHAFIARDSKAIVVTRDGHFRKLQEIAKVMKPEDII